MRPTKKKTPTKSPLQRNSYKHMHIIPYSSLRINISDGTQKREARKRQRQSAFNIFIYKRETSISKLPHEISCMVEITEQRLTAVRIFSYRVYLCLFC